MPVVLNTEILVLQYSGVLMTHPKLKHMKSTNNKLCMEFPARILKIKDTT